MITVRETHDSVTLKSGPGDWQKIIAMYYLCGVLALVMILVFLEAINWWYWLVPTLSVTAPLVALIFYKKDVLNVSKDKLTVKFCWSLFQTREFQFESVEEDSGTLTFFNHSKSILKVSHISKVYDGALEITFESGDIRGFGVYNDWELLYSAITEQLTFCGTLKQKEKLTPTKPKAN